MDTAVLKIDKYALKGTNNVFPKYASKGDIVKIISWHDEVAIVEGKGGRFSIRREFLKKT